ncbi:MAG: patatin-like phospholipase family protein [Bryobacterales bacterium]|nr:patatin-like phospholipase family protein [Bryobacterales bacterium]
MHPLVMIPTFLLGYVLASVIVFASEAARAAFTLPNQDKEAPVVWLIWPSVDGEGSWISHGLAQWRDHDVPAVLVPLKQGFSAFWRWPGLLLQPFVDKGYQGRMAPAHTYAGFVAVLTLSLYMGLAMLHQEALFGAIWSPRTPAFAWISLLLALVTFVLSGFTFFFDRFRFPLFLGCLLLMAITSVAPESDHYYRLGSPSTWTPPTAAEVIAQRPADQPIIVVSAPGGGIQSAAWTTYALSKLSEDYQKTRGRPLMEDITAISAVSGGSVGTFHLAAANFDPHIAFENAIKSSIDDVAWGFLVPDLARAIFPWGRDREIDRGFALEQSLELHADVESLYMHDEDLVPHKGRPAILINSTILETGEPIVFGTSSFRASPPRDADSPACGPDVRPDPDRGIPLEHWNLYRRPIRLATAARLSSTFPYVSPSARSTAESPACPDYHLLDGGYYDNYGILSLAHWLIEGLPQGQPRKVILIALRPFPDEEARPTVAGWGAQVTAPLRGVLSARESSQERIGKFVLQLSSYSQIDVRPPIELRYRPPAGSGCAVAPLNWVLTPREVDCIRLSLNQADLDAASTRLREESR